MDSSEPSEQRRSERIACSGPREVVNRRLVTPLAAAKKGYVLEPVEVEPPPPRIYPQPAPCQPEWRPRRTPHFIPITDVLTTVILIVGDATLIHDGFGPCND